MKHSVLKKGSKGEEVKVLQALLFLKQDGIFGRLTEEAVKEFQRSVGLEDDGIVGERTWYKIEATKVFRSKRTITEIIVHCTDTPEGREHTVDDIRSWHKAQGWADIGYHYVVDLEGKVHNGRSVDLIGAHCSGHNTHSIGVVYVGGCAARIDDKGKIVPAVDAKGNVIHKDTRTEAQKKALMDLLLELRKLYPAALIRGHRDFANRPCPCFDAKNEYRKI